MPTDWLINRIDYWWISVCILDRCKSTNCSKLKVEKKKDATSNANCEQSWMPSDIVLDSAHRRIITAIVSISSALLTFTTYYSRRCWNVFATTKIKWSIELLERDLIALINSNGYVMRSLTRHHWIYHTEESRHYNRHRLQHCVNIIIIIISILPCRYKEEKKIC